MSEWSYHPTQVGIVPQTPLNSKPNERILTSTPILEEEKDDTDTSSVHAIPPCLTRLDSTSDDGERALRSLSESMEDSSSEDIDRPLTEIPRSSDDSNPSPVFENNLGVNVATSSINSVSQVPIPLNQSAIGVNARDCVSSESTPEVPIFGNNIGNSNRFKSLFDCKNQYEVRSANSTSSSASGCLSPSAISNSNSSAFPSEPSILADKYLILGNVDANTSHALHIRNHQPLHIKAVSPQTAREVCAQQALLGDCPGVRAPLESVLSPCGRRAYLVFPPHFGDLHSHVRLRRRLREAEAQRLFSQVAATVEQCHSAGLVLRDLKLRKFVFTDSNRQKVVLESVEDSVVAGEADFLHDKHGCPAYVAPEILSATAYSGRQADMWGLGVILYTMLVGRYPFHNADTSTLFARIRSGKFVIPEWVSSRARHLIHSLLRRQPQRRLSAHQVMLHPWLNRSPRDHVGRDPQDHMVPLIGEQPGTPHHLPPTKSRSAYVLT